MTEFSGVTDPELARAASFGQTGIQQERERVAKGMIEDADLAAVCAVNAREDIAALYLLASINSTRSRKILFWTRVAAASGLLSLAIIAAKFL